MKLLRGIFNDRLTRTAGIIFVLIIAVVVFDNYSNLPYQHPLLGVFAYGAVLVLFIAGGIVFALAILRS